MKRIKELFLNKKFLSFAVIGGINTIGAQILYMVFVLFKVSVGLSSLLGDCITMLFSYFLNMKYTYHMKISWKSFITFPISYIPGIIIAMIMTMVITSLGAPELFAKALSLPITIPLNYIVMSFVVKKTAEKRVN